MRIHKARELSRNITKSLQETQHILDNFESNNLEHCSRISHTIVKLYEARTNPSILIHNKDNYSKLVKYFNTIYSAHTCLILRRDFKEFSYSRNNIMKFLRGSWAHMDNKKNKKDEVIDDYLYENNDVEAVFCISKDFIYFPCSLLYEGQNSDSSRPICETIQTFDGGKVELTLLESVLVGICNDVSNLLRFGEMKWRKPVLFLEGIDGYISSNEIRTKVLNESRLWKEFRNDE